MHLKEFFKKYIANTPEKAVIVERKMFLGYLTKAVMEGLEIKNSTKKTTLSCGTGGTATPIVAFWILTRSLLTLRSRAEFPAFQPHKTM